MIFWATLELPEFLFSVFASSLQMDAEMYCAALVPISSRLKVATSQKAVTLIVTSQISQCSVHVSNQVSVKSYAAMRSHPDYLYFTYKNKR